MISEAKAKQWLCAGQEILGGLIHRKILFVSSVGSHMWGMQTEESDIDLAIIYAASTKAILRGEKISCTTGQEIAVRNGEVYDIIGWEVGHLIDQLIRGNINAIWYASSPLIIKPSAFQKDLADIVASNISRSCHHSIKGMAESQIKSEKALKNSRMAGKGLQTALRTINFGIRLMSQGIISFEPVCITPEKDEVMERLARLDEVYLSSSLPNRPDEGAFREFLFKLRLEGLSEEERSLREHG